jgi:hypothetical protein
LLTPVCGQYLPSYEKNIFGYLQVIRIVGSVAYNCNRNQLLSTKKLLHWKNEEVIILNLNFQTPKYIIRVLKI